MKWSWKIGRLAGIELRVHATFIILLAWLAFAYYRQSGSAVGAAEGIVFTLALFASVIVHEFGHALTGRRFGVPTRDITLLPIGGVARLEYIPEQPRQELAIAVAGPAVTLGIVILLFLLARALALPLTFNQDVLGDGARPAFVVQLMWVNVTLLVFNLLPAFPMDGGRVLRAALALRMTYVRATEIAAGVGRAFALIFGAVGFFYNPILVLIALFVWLGAAAESSATQVKSSLAGVDVERVMISDVRTLAPNDTLDTALNHVLAGFQQDFPVLENGRVVGVLTRSALLAGLARDGRDASVSSAMERSFKTAQPTEPVERAMARLRQCSCHTLPVLSDGHLEGVLTLDNIGEYLMIDAALHGSTHDH